MFANLKNKLIEEVKASPSKFQQFANAAQAAVSSSSSATPIGSESTTAINENFFSITEEDTPQNSPYRPLKLTPGAMRGRASPHSMSNGSTGAIPRTRKLSNSSVASDISFRLPFYESSSAYHLQSDLESSSEFEDSASSMKLDVVTKEQLYDAYKKSLDRYQKYRCRYTDLAKKYKDLERDSSKARSVLVETQEKAIRRISELREQCTLEQEAKAHLEEALRVEMDDMQCKMQAYQTKLQLLGENPEQIAATLAATCVNNANANEASLIDLNAAANDELNGDVENNLMLLEAAETTASEQCESVKITELAKQLADRDLQLAELTTKFKKSLATMQLLRKQEEENALLLAQTKQAIHLELESKDSEVKQLQEVIKKMQTELQIATEKDNQFCVQETELNELRLGIKQAQSEKQDLDAKIIASEHLFAELKEKYTSKEKALLAIEATSSNLTKDSEQKLLDIRLQNAQLSEMIERYQQNEVSLAEIDNELNRTKNENDMLRETLRSSQHKLETLEREHNVYQEENRQKSLASEEKLLIADRQIQEYAKQLEDIRLTKEITEQKLKQLESEIRILSEQNANNETETVSALKQELHKTSNDLNEEVRAIKEQLSSKEKELKASSNKQTKLKKQHETQQSRVKDQAAEIEKLKHSLVEQEQHLLAIQRESKEREERTTRENNELKQQITNILHEISQMEEQMRIVQHSHGELEEEKRCLEAKIVENLQRQSQHADSESAIVKHWQEQLVEVEVKLQQVEVKLQNVESENSQLSEKNCLLEENANRLEKLMAERERQQTVAEEATASEMRLKLETAEDALQKLNDKMSQVLDENSRMHNAQELMDHDYRTLQDKYDALEKEKLLAVDAQKCNEEQLQAIKNEKLADDVKLQETIEQLKNTEEQLDIVRREAASTQHELQEFQNWRAQLEEESLTLREQLNAMKEAQSDDDKLKVLLDAKQQRIEELVVKEKALQAELSTSQGKLLEIASVAEVLEHKNEELLLTKENSASLNEELEARVNELQEKNTIIERMEAKVTEYESNKTLLNALKENEQVLNGLLNITTQKLDAMTAQYQEIQTRLMNAQESSEQLEQTKQQLNEMRAIKQSHQNEVNASKQKYSFDMETMELNATEAAETIAKLRTTNQVLEKQMQQLQGEQQSHVKELEAAIVELREQANKYKENHEMVLENVDKLGNYDQLQIENEYLNKHVKQLESDLKEEQQSTIAKHSDTNEVREKLKSMQCELYVLKENEDTHNAVIEEKQKEISALRMQLEELIETNKQEREESTRLANHSKYITEQNDIIQKELLHAQNTCADLENKREESKVQWEATNLELAELNESSDLAGEAKDTEIHGLHDENERNRITIEFLNKEVNDLTAALQVKEKLATEIDALKIELAERMTITQLSTGNSEASPKSVAQSEAENLRKINAALQHELEDLKSKSTAEICNLQQEIDDMQSIAKHMTEKMAEYDRLQQHLSARSKDGPYENTSTQIERKEKEELEAKLKNIMLEVQDVSNRNLFLEQKCENFLILEQSNERLKLQNAKLLRQLDETLVSMQHNESITANTEFEYLKNIMFQYLTGSANGNNETLVKVISAVLKFSPQQTQVAVEKEHQRRSVLNKIL